MKTSELNYELPQALVAAKPASPRDSAKILVLNKKTGNLAESTFLNLGDFLNPGDVLVFNKTKVFPARAFGVKETGGKVEVIFLSEIKPDSWEVILGGKVKNGQKLIFGAGLEGTVEKTEQGNFLIVNQKAGEVFATLEKIGHVPLPPYIKRKDNKADKKEYQTVFAESVGSAAAPTASLHFSKRLLKSLEKQGVQQEFVTLHVGLGTFAPVKTEILEDHPIHSEYFELEEETAKKLNKAKEAGRRIIAVGTTTVRVLESAVEKNQLIPKKGTTDLFIYPGYKFKVVKGLITNFHTPSSSLLGLVFAFAGQDNIKKAYQYAIKKKFRFFSYGDGMFIE